MLNYFSVQILIVCFNRQHRLMIKFKKNKLKIQPTKHIKFIKRYLSSDEPRESKSGELPGVDPVLIHMPDVDLYRSVVFRSDQTIRRRATKQKLKKKHFFDQQSRIIKKKIATESKF